MTEKQPVPPALPLGREVCAAGRRAAAATGLLKRFAICVLFLAAVGPATKDSFGEEPMIFELPNAPYDPELRLVRKYYEQKRDAGHDNIHEKQSGSVHPMLESVEYANRLMSLNDPAARERAIEIYDRVLEFQDTDPESRTYGVWAKFYEDDLQAQERPDYNWAEFVGKAYLEAVMLYGDQLPEDLKDRIRQAHYHATREMMKRNSSYGYTNICAQSILVTLVTAEIYDDAELFEFATNRLKGFYEHTLYHGNFCEFNSPTYTVITLRALGRLRDWVKDPKSRERIEYLYHRCWEVIATHHHPPTGQWSGPHGRSYSNMLAPWVRNLIDEAVDQPEKSLVPCPADLVHYFKEFDGPREMRDTFQKADPDADLNSVWPQVLPTVGTTYLTESFTLGTVNHGTFWKQRYSLVAYWVSPGEENCGGMFLKLMKDGFEFVGGTVFIEQSKGDALGCFVFATDTGDAHGVHPIPNGTFTTRDLRLHFEFDGSAKEMVFAVPDSASETVRVEVDGVSLQLAAPLGAAPLGAVDGCVPRWESSPGAVDLVLYEGPERAFNLFELQEGALAFAVRMGGPEAAPLKADAVRDGEWIRAEFEGLAMVSPIRPETQARNLVRYRDANGVR